MRFYEVHTAHHMTRVHLIKISKYLLFLVYQTSQHHVSAEGQHQVFWNVKVVEWSMDYITAEQES